MASIGPVSISTGSTPTRHWSTIRARGDSPRSFAFAAVISSTAAAPSVIWEDEPAVCTPFSRPTGLSLANASSDVSRSPSSRVTVCVLSVGLPSSSTSGASTGVTSRSNRPSAHARCARVCDSSPKRSQSSRVTPHFSAMRSAPSNCDVTSYRAKYDFGVGPSEVAPYRGPEWHPAHALDPAAQRDVDDAGLHQRGREVGGLLRGAALGVDCRGRDFERHPGGQPRGARDVERLLADLAHAPAHDLADLVRIEAGTVDGGPLYLAEEVGGMDRLEPAVAAAERRADCLDDDDIGVCERGHGSSRVLGELGVIEPPDRRRRWYRSASDVLRAQ